MIRIGYYSDASCADAYQTSAMGDLLRNQTNALDHVQNLEIHAVRAKYLDVFFSG